MINNLRSLIMSEASKSTNAILQTVIIQTGQLADMAVFFLLMALNWERPRRQVEITWDFLSQTCILDSTRWMMCLGNPGSSLFGSKWRILKPPSISSWGWEPGSSIHRPKNPGARFSVRSTIRMAICLVSPSEVQFQSDTFFLMVINRAYSIRYS